MEKILLKHGWEEVSNWECLFVLRQKRLFFSVNVDDMKLVGKKQSIDPMWKLLGEKSVWENQHLSLIMKTWDALKGNVKKKIMDKYRTMFESRISAERTEKLPYSENLRISSWSYDMIWRVMQRNVWSDIVS